MTTVSNLRENVSTATVTKPGLLQNRKFINVVLKVLLYIILTIGLLALLLPSFWMVSTSFKEVGTEFARPIEWLPREVVFSNYTGLPQYFPIFQYTINTLILVVGNLLGTLLTASMVAYAFARLRWPGRNWVFGTCLATMMLPGVVTMIPTFIIFKQLGWLNTFMPLIIGSWFGGGAFNIFLIRQFFMTLPMEIDEAARIDGATGLTIWSRIVIPLSKPVLATVAIFTFLSHWNDFMGPLIYLNDQRLYPLSVGLSMMFNTYTGYGNAVPLIGPVMAASVLMTLPIIVIFFVGQQYFVRGISTTGMAAR
jgi:ABC-type glycerol-3-phosphate transport system permease component